jgi:hypothetical protein
MAGMLRPHFFHFRPGCPRQIARSIERSQNLRAFHKDRAAGNKSFASLVWLVSGARGELYARHTRIVAID